MKKLLIAIASLASLGSAWAQVTERVNVNSIGAQADGGGDLGGGDLPLPGAVVSADGRYVAFRCPSHLDLGDTNGTWDVFVRDRLTATTERVSVDSNGALANGSSGEYGINISPDGRYVVFESAASNLDPGDANGARDVFLRDRLNGTTEQVSLRWDGGQGDGLSLHPSISADGRYVAFTSDATNLISGDWNFQADVFVRDRVNGTTELVSMSSQGTGGNGVSDGPSISADGRFVAFHSSASTFVTGDTNAYADVFLRDRVSGTTIRVSLSSAGDQGNRNSWEPSISADGRYVAFLSQADNLVAGDTNGFQTDCFVRDLQSGTTELVSISTGGTTGNGNSIGASISADGNFVTFSSGATNLVPGVPGPQAYLRDRQHNTTEVVSVATDGSLSNASCVLGSVTPGGRYVAFRSAATNLVPGDTNGNVDVFIHDRLATGFTSTCHPGTNNVLPCPCANPPSGQARGCDNSASTGGAALSASGIAYLSIDSLVFTTSGELPSATSLLLQGSASLPNGLVFGQGVRCAGGTLRRLYVKTASGGSISAPDVGSGDPSISARSAQLGDPILPGTRYYLVYYRDPIVLGGCPATSTFNATQTGQISWWP